MQRAACSDDFDQIWHVKDEPGPELDHGWEGAPIRGPLLRRRKPGKLTGLDHNIFVARCSFHEYCRQFFVRSRGWSRSASPSCLCDKEKEHCKEAETMMNGTMWLSRQANSI
jgi:hypothetical protein